MQPLSTASCLQEWTESPLLAVLHISQGWLSFWQSSHPFAIFWYASKCFCLQSHVIRLTISDNLWVEWVSGAWQLRHLSIYHLPKNTSGCSEDNWSWLRNTLVLPQLPYPPFAGLGTSVTHNLLSFYKVSIFLKQKPWVIGKLHVLIFLAKGALLINIKI